jgi:membrane protein DedA with SNARE-associated domain
VRGLAARFIEWLTAYTYPVVFLGTLIDATGVPFPGRVLLIAAGALAGTGRRHVAVVIGAGALAAMIMDTLWYVAGARGSTRLLALFRRFTGTESASDSAIDYFARYGVATIILGRFFTSLRMFAWPAAAAHGLGYGRFLLFDLVGAVIWASTWVLIGWFVGARWESAAQTAGVGVAAGGAVVLVVAIAPLVMRMWRRRGRRRRAVR